MAEKETNNGKSGPEKKNVRKRFNAKSIGRFIKRYGTSVYMLTAFCLVAAVTFSVLALNMNYSDIGNEIEIPDIKIPTLPDRVVTLPTEKRVDSVQTGVNANITGETKRGQTTEAAKPTVKYVSPVSGKIVKKYAEDVLVFSSTLGDYRTHSGIDIAASVGAPVFAYSDGTVEAIEDTPMMGKTVKISHKYGLTSVYMNLSDELPAGIKAGAEIKAGDRIGKVGRTAIAEIGDAPHLHFELKLNGANIDPEKELENLN